MSRIQISKDDAARVCRELGLSPRKLYEAALGDGDYGPIDRIVTALGHEVGPNIDYPNLEGVLVKLDEEGAM